MFSLSSNKRARCLFRVVIARPCRRAYRDAIRHTGIATAVIAILLAGMKSHAAEIEPRAYVNTPVGINFLLAGYAYSDGGLATTGSSPIKDAQLTMNTGILAYARSLNVCGKSGKFDIILPYSGLSGSAMVDGQPRERKVSGLHDPLMRFSVNFYGAPAVSVTEFSNYQQDVIIGASVQISAPVGQYDSDKLVNLGNNRWFVKPDIGVSKVWGPFALELSTGVFFFSKNDDYFGGKVLEQDPIYTAQAHLAYNFSRGVWTAVSVTNDYVGRTTIDDVQSNDLEDNSRVGVTLALPVNRNSSVKLFASTSIHTSIGADLGLAGIVWQYRWGNGL